MGPLINPFRDWGLNVIRFKRVGNLLEPATSIGVGC